MGTTNRPYSRKMEVYHQKNNEIATDFVTYDHHLIKGSRVITLNKLT